MVECQVAFYCPYFAKRNIHTMAFPSYRMAKWNWTMFSTSPHRQIQSSVVPPWRYSSSEAVGELSVVANCRVHEFVANVALYAYPEDHLGMTFVFWLCPNSANSSARYFHQSRIAWMHWRDTTRFETDQVMGYVEDTYSQFEALCEPQLVPKKCFITKKNEKIGPKVIKSNWPKGQKIQYNLHSWSCVDDFQYS